MGVGEADCATCHLEMKGPRCLFPALTLKSFPASALPPQQDWRDVQALLHIWLPEKGLWGCVLAAEGEAQCGGLTEDLLASGQPGWIGGERPREGLW